MLGFAETLGGTLAAFLLPALVGLSVISALARYASPRYLAAFAIGLYLWFFSDTVGDASLLGVSEGFAGGAFHFALWLAFAAGVLVFFSIDSKLFAEGSAGGSLGFAIPLLVAVAFGVHGLGEGAAVGATAASFPGTSLLAAFGGLSATASFLLHKALEPMVAGAAYWAYARDHARDTAGRAKDIAVLALAFALPGIIGGSSSYYLVQVYPSADFTYVFALGLGTSIYAAIRVARPLFQGTGSNSESLRTALAVVLGFACLYLAASLHS